MAVIQLIDLSVGSKDISEFRFYKNSDVALSPAYHSLSGPNGLVNAVASNRNNGLADSQWTTKKKDFPNNAWRLQL